MEERVLHKSVSAPQRGVGNRQVPAQRWASPSVGSLLQDLGASLGANCRHIGPLSHPLKILVGLFPLTVALGGSGGLPHNPLAVGSSPTRPTGSGDLCSRNARTGSPVIMLGGRAPQTPTCGLRPPRFPACSVLVLGRQQSVPPPCAFLAGLKC
jgi:hypothetical protein